MSRRAAGVRHRGRVRRLAGTLASAAAIPLAWALHWAGGFPALAVATALIYAIGLPATRARLRADGDRRAVVIDQVAGMWVALMPLSAGLWIAGAAPWVFPWPGWLAAFLLFRLFDTWKPWPVAWADRRPDPTGVMFGAALAGLMAAGLVTLAAGLAHGWLR